MEGLNTLFFSRTTQPFAHSFQQSNYEGRGKKTSRKAKKTNKADERAGKLRPAWANPYLSNWPTLYKKNHKFFAGVHRKSKIKDIDQKLPPSTGQ